MPLIHYILKKTTFQIEDHWQFQPTEPCVDSRSRNSSPVWIFTSCISYLQTEQLC